MTIQQRETEIDSEIKNQIDRLKKTFSNLKQDMPKEINDQDEQRTSKGRGIPLMKFDRYNHLKKQIFFLQWIARIALLRIWRYWHENRQSDKSYYKSLLLWVFH